MDNYRRSLPVHEMTTDSEAIDSRSLTSENDKPVKRDSTTEDDIDDGSPINWPQANKWRVVAIVSIMAFLTPLASTMFAPAIPQLMNDFHCTKPILGTMVVSIYVLGQALGPLLCAPASEIYGRRPIYLISNFLFLIFTIACAVSSNMSMLITFRFLAGCAGGVPTSLGGATIGDMFVKEKRGAAMAAWGICPQLAPALGPVMGGFLAQAEGWRWVFWVQVTANGFILLLGIFFLRETYVVVIRAHKKKAAGRTIAEDAIPNPRGHLVRAFTRPIKMLFTSPIIFLLSLYTALLFGYLYLFITSFPLVFQKRYNFSTGTSGLTYLGLGVGSFIGLVLMGKTGDPIYQKLTARNDGKARPEFRLPPAMLTAPMVAVAFFWYGWSAEAKTHWIVPIIGTSLFSMGMMPAFISINTYLVDAYTIYSASALAASKLLQSLLAAFLPLAATPMYDRLGFGWGNSVLGFIALAFVPVPWLFFRYGEGLRTRFPIEF